MKRYLRITVSTALTIAILLAAFLVLQTNPRVAVAQDRISSEQPVRNVSVSGQGQIDLQPDLAIIEVGVNTQAKDASAALSQNNTKMTALITALKQAGVADQDIQTNVVQLQPQYSSTDSAGTGQAGSSSPVTLPQLIGYQATNLVSVRSKALDKLGGLLDAVVKAGGNRIDGIRFEVSDPSQALDQARQAAWNDARHKAEQLAQLAGAQLGDVMTINETSNTPVPIARNTFMASASANVPIQPGSQTIQVDIQVTWSLTGVSSSGPTSGASTTPAPTPKP